MFYKFCSFWAAFLSVAVSCNEWTWCPDVPTVHVKTGASVGEPQRPYRSYTGFVSDWLGDLEPVLSL